MGRSHFLVCWSSRAGRNECLLSEPPPRVHDIFVTEAREETAYIWIHSPPRRCPACYLAPWNNTMFISAPASPLTASPTWSPRLSQELLLWFQLFQLFCIHGLKRSPLMVRPPPPPGICGSSLCSILTPF